LRRGTYQIAGEIYYDGVQKTMWDWDINWLKTKSLVRAAKYLARNFTKYYGFA
jgi:hypothetical protein